MIGASPQPVQLRACCVLAQPVGPSAEHGHSATGRGNALAFSTVRSNEKGVLRSSQSMELRP